MEDCYYKGKEIIQIYIFKLIKKFIKFVYVENSASAIFFYKNNPSFFIYYIMLINNNMLNLPDAATI